MIYSGGPNLIFPEYLSQLGDKIAELDIDLEKLYQIKNRTKKTNRYRQMESS